MRRTVVFSTALAVSVLLCGCSGGHRADPARGRAAGERAHGDSSDGAAIEMARRPEPARSRTRHRREAAPESEAMPKEEKGEWCEAPTSDESFAKRETGIRSGTLTAGSFDDVDRFEDFCRFVGEAVRRDSGEQLPRLTLGHRAMIHVADATAARLPTPESSSAPSGGSVVSVSETIAKRPRCSIFPPAPMAGRCCSPE